MAQNLTKLDFLADLHHQIDNHCETVIKHFNPLDDQVLQWRPAPKAWNILQCIDHLNLTHDYYLEKIERALPTAPNHTPDDDRYRPSFWGRIYMYFALNPNYSFPSPEPVAPQQTIERQVLATYLAK